MATTRSMSTCDNCSLDAEIYGTLNVHAGTQGPEGPQGPAGYTPVKGVDYFTPDDIAEIVEELKASGGDGVNFTTDETLSLQAGILSVNTTNIMEEDNTLPISSAGVYATVGNIEALLKTL